MLMKKTRVHRKICIFCCSLNPLNWDTYLGETNLICWSTSMADLILSKNKKNNITKFWLI